MAELARDKAALATEVAAATARAEDERTNREAAMARLTRLQKVYVRLLCEVPRSGRMHTDRRGYTYACARGHGPVCVLGLNWQA